MHCSWQPGNSPSTLHLSLWDHIFKSIKVLWSFTNHPSALMWPYTQRPTGLFCVKWRFSFGIILTLFISTIINFIFHSIWKFLEYQRISSSILIPGWKGNSSLFITLLLLFLAFGWTTMCRKISCLWFAWKLQYLQVYPIWPSSWVVPMCFLRFIFIFVL